MNPTAIPPPIVGPHPCLRGARALSPKARALAMDPAAVRRLCLESLQAAAVRSDGSVLRFQPLLTLEQTASAYLRQANPPPGEVSRLARAHGHNYPDLLQAICRLQHSFRSA